LLTVRKAKAEDFEAIYPLLQEMDSSLAKSDWQQLFVTHYGGSEDYFGYAAFDQNRAVGFMGLIFSERLIRGKPEKICNMSTWIVKKEYRKEGVGLSILSEVVSLANNYTITGLNPGNKAVLSAYKSFGYKELDTISKILLPVPTLSLLFNKCSIELNPDIVRRCLNDKDLKFYHDHLKFRCLHFVIKTKDNYCYFIAKKTKRKNMPLAEIHYISNFDVFFEFMPQIRFLVCLRLGILGLLMDERFLMGHNIKYSINCSVRRIFLSNTLGRNDITDNLYTELLILPVF